MRKLAGVLLLVSGVGLSGPVAAQGDANEAALRTLLDELLSAVEQGDNVRMDETVCLDWQSSARMHRLQAYGALPQDALGAAELAAAYRDAYRAALTEFVGWQQRMGGSVSALDMERVQLYGDDSQEGLPALGQTAELPITAGGTLAVQWKDREHVSDIPVMRVGDYWCLNPVSVP